MGQEGNATSWQVETLYLLHEQEVEIWTMFFSIHSVELIFSINNLYFFSSWAVKFGSFLWE